jgi:Ice-binding-like
MSNRSHHRRLRRAGLAVAAVLALGAIPAVAQAAPVNLATASPFAVLGGAEVTNTGPSVLKGALGVSPGTSLTGFALPATVLGATHANDAVASQAQADLTTAFGVAGEQAVPPGNELTGIDLGGLTLTPGAYNYSSSAQLTGQLTLNAQGDPNAQFVFIVGSTLTTASASSVILINGASPCNVFWKIGSSATFGEATQFQGNVLAHEDISVNDAVHVEGRLLAARAITLINDVIDNSKCAASTETESETGTTTPSTTTTSGVPSSGGVATTTTASTTSGTPTTRKSTTANGGSGNQKTPTPTGSAKGTSTVTRGAAGPNGTMVTVAGKRIAGIVVSVDNKTVRTSHAPSLRMLVNGAPGTHKVTVRVSYKGQTTTKVTTFRIHVPSPAPLHPHPGPSEFTG